MSETGAATPHDITVDFMDMTRDRRLWARPVDVKDQRALAAGQHVIVGDEDADARLARVVSIDADGNIELEVLDDSVDSRRDLLESA